MHEIKPSYAQYEQVCLKTCNFDTPKAFNTNVKWLTDWNTLVFARLALYCGYIDYASSADIFRIALHFTKSSEISKLQDMV